jgi:hypothetical protein
LGISLFGRARAAEGPSAFRLSWLRGHGAESCPAAQELERAVTARLGRDPFAEDAREAIEASVARSGDSAWHVQVQVRDAEGKAIGRRDLDTEASDCRAIADATALAIALAIDPNAELEPTPPPRPVTSPPASASQGSTVACPAAPVCPTPAPCRCAPRENAPMQSAVAGRRIVASGILPGVVYGAGVFGELGIGRWHATLGFIWLAESGREGLAFGLSTAVLGACVDAVRSDSMTLGACAGGELGAMHSVVTDPNLRPVGTGERVWAAAELAAYLRWRGWQPLYAELGGSLVVALTRPEFGVRDEPTARYQSEVFSGIGFVGLGVFVP